MSRAAGEWERAQGRASTFRVEGFVGINVLLVEVFRGLVRKVALAIHVVAAVELRGAVVIPVRRLKHLVTGDW